MTTTPLAGDTQPAKEKRGRQQLAGLILLAGIVAFMWAVEVVNTLDSNRLDGDGIYARDLGRLWGILTAPFIHGSFQHLIDNTIPFVFMGAIIAIAGIWRLAKVTLFVIVLGGLGTWLIAPSNSVTFGASGVVFGYATYLFAIGFFERSWLDLLAGVLVGAVWGAALLASLVPHQGVSWQAHACGAVAGVLAAFAFSDRRRGRTAKPPAAAV